MSIVDGLRRQWPIALALGALLAVELVWVMAGGGREIGTWLPAVPACAAAVVAYRFPLPAIAVAAVSVFLTSLVIATHGTHLESPLSPLTMAETAACMALVAVVVRCASWKSSAVGVGVLVVVSLHAAVVRTGFSWTQSNVVGSLLLGVLAVGAGLYFKARDAERDRVLSTAVSGAQREERIELARELHDVVAHHVTGMLVQAQAALEVSEDDPGAAHRLLPGIVHSGTEALGAMRRLVGTLREGGVDVATTDLGADVLATVERMRGFGVPVRLRMDLPPDVPPELGRSVLRLVQESLTNAHRHAVRPTGVDVELSRTPTALRVVVTDDGRGGPVRVGGYGLVGMRERVGLLGGLFSAGPHDRGWQVLAELPWEGHK